jgi:hypothetical protein
MEAVRTSETSVYFNENTRRCNPETYLLILKWKYAEEGEPIHLSVRSFIPNTNAWVSRNFGIYRLHWHHITLISFVRNEFLMWCIDLFNEIRSKQFMTMQRVSLEPGSSVNIVSGYGLDDRALEVRSPAEVRNFSSNLCIQTVSGAHPASCTMRTGVLSPGLKRGRGVTLTTHPHLVPKSWMSRSYTSSPPKRLHGV